MDAEAVVRRAPELALIDELAHTNAPGSAQRQALPGHRRRARRRDRRHLDRQRPAPGEPERRRLRADRRARAGDVPRPDPGRGRRGGAGRPRARGAARAAAGGQGVPGRSRSTPRSRTSSGPRTWPRCASSPCASCPRTSRRGARRACIDRDAQQAILERILVLVEPAAELTAAAAPGLALGPAARAPTSTRSGCAARLNADRGRARSRWPRCAGWRCSWASTSSRRRSRRRDRRGARRGRSTVARPTCTWAPRRGAGWRRLLRGSLLHAADRGAARRRHPASPPIAAAARSCGR